MDGPAANDDSDRDDIDATDASHDLSRRVFLTASAIGASAASVGSTTSASAAEETIPSIRIPVEITESLAADPKPASFETKGRRPGMSGAAVFAKACKSEG